MRQVMNGDLPEVCGACGEIRRYVGTRRKQVIVCGCPREGKAKPRLNTARKGRRLEVAERKKLEKLGVGRVRMQPGSGAFGTRENETALQGDNTYVVAGMRVRQECKSRASDDGFKVLSQWMRDCDQLTIKVDRQPAIHVMTDEYYCHLVAAANKGAGEP